MTQNPHVEAFFDDATNTISYVVTGPKSKACAIIDSVLEFDMLTGRTGTGPADRLIDYVRQNGLECAWLLETHVHADHLSAAPYLQQKLGGKLAIGEDITVVQNTFGKFFNAGSEFERDGSQFDRLLKDGDTLKLGTMDIKVIHTPGHTPACMTYVIGDAAFVGDTLFMPDYGTARADFPGGDATALYRSIQKILSLPEDTRLFLCHDYKSPGRSEYAWETTVAEQLAGNVHAHLGVSEKDFVAMRTARDAKLNPPKLIVPSIQVNMRAGHMPAAEDNGTVYLKVPVNVL